MLRRIPTEDLEQEPTSQAGQESVLPPDPAGDSVGASATEGHKRPESSDAAEPSSPTKARMAAITGFTMGTLTSANVTMCWRKLGLID